jgi:hypothetical protein
MSKEQWDSRYAEEVFEDFRQLDIIDLAETQVVLDEGNLHRGLAEIVRLTIRKP